MSILTKLGLAAGLVLALCAGIWGYGRLQYSAGARDARALIQREQIDIALGQQVEKDRADAEYRGRVLATQMARKDLAGKLVDSDRMLRSLRKRLLDAGTCSGLNDAGEDWIGVLGASWAEYTDMAGEAGRLADKVTGLQGYVRAVSSDAH